VHCDRMKLLFSLCYLIGLVASMPQIDNSVQTDAPWCALEHERIKEFNEEASPMACQFPFIYKGVTYNECTTVEEDKPWCSTETNPTTNEHVGEGGHWGYCFQENCPKEVKIEVTKASGSEGSPDVCNFKSCNGEQYSFENEYGNDTLTMGQCQMELGPGSGLFCFVNEDSVCEKKESSKQGKFISFEACKDAPPSFTRRNFFTWISNAFKDTVNFFANLFGAETVYPERYIERGPANAQEAETTTINPFKRRLNNLVSS